jgi:hypothetical protein
MSSSFPATSTPAISTDHSKLEAVTVSVGFDDMLDVTLGANMPHLDEMYVVTSHEDKKTAGVAIKHGARLIQTDLFKKNGRNFNKGAAINHGFNYFQWLGWRMHLDADIALPDNFRRILFNRTHLDPECIYGCDRMDIVGLDAFRELRATLSSDGDLMCGSRPLWVTGSSITITAIARLDFSSFGTPVPTAVTLTHWAPRLTMTPCSRRSGKPSIGVICPQSSVLIF